MWNTDRGLIGLDGFLKTVNFVTHLQGNGTKQMSGATLKSINPLPFNFGDSGVGFGVQPSMFWLAARNLNPSILFNEMKKLEFSLENSASELAGNRLLPFLLIWGMVPDLSNLQAPTETTYIAQGKSAVAGMRSGWESNDIYLAVKGGTPSANHAHMDIGSFVMEVNDVRWAADFGMSNYNNLETNGVDLWNMAQTSERWDVFRLNNMAHNTLTFNGKKQLVKGNITIENFINTPELKSVSMNLTPVYEEDVSSCLRTASIVSNRYVEIKDEIKARSSSLTTRWNLLTQAVPIKVSEKIVKLVQSTKTLYLILDGVDDVKSNTWSTKPPTTYEEQNDGYSFAGFEFTIPAGSSKTITVKLVPAGDPLLDGLDLNSVGQLLNEDFETFNLGTTSASFVNWKLNPPTNGSLKAVLGEVVVNPYKVGINTSEKVLKIQRQDDSEYITPANSSNVTYRGAQAYGYDLKVSSNSVIEFKYYKNAPGKVGIRLYDGVNTSPLILDYTDPNETTDGYTTAQWRTARFAVGKLDYSKYNFTPYGYLLISLERNGTEPYQERELIMYVDDVKMLSIKASQTITFLPLADKTYGDAPFTLSATSSSGLALAYTSDNTEVASVSGNTVTIVGAGTATITASQAGNSNYSPALDAAQALTVNKAPQTITFTTLPTKAFGDAPFALSATSSTGLPLIYTSSDPSVAVVDGNTVTIVGAGTATITAIQAGNNNYSSVSSLQSLIVNKASQAITFTTLSTKTFGDAPFTLSGTSSSGLPLAYTGNPAIVSINGSTVTIITAGRATVTATQPGNPNYNAADPVSQSFCINPAKPAISLSNADAPIPLLTSSASEGNQWYLDGVAVDDATGTTLRATKTGIYKVQVTVGGCTSTFSDELPFLVTGVEPSDLSVGLYPNPVTDLLSISFGGTGGDKQVTVFALTGESLISSSTNSASIEMDVANFTAGLYLARVTVNDRTFVMRFVKH
jgi:outer membrane lipoprotein-sorting protein